MTNSKPRIRSAVAICAILILAIVGDVQRASLDNPANQLPNNKEALLNNPYKTPADPAYANVRELPKHDRPDLAMRQFMEMTADPSDQQSHPERAIVAFRQAQRILSSDDYARNVDLTEAVWEERGPTNVGGRTRALMFDPNDPTSKKVWAAGVSGGLWTNDNIDDANTPWQSVDDFWANLAITALDFDPSNPQTMYAGTGEGYFNINTIRGEGIWKTTDGGSTWAQLSSTSNNPDFYTVHDLIVLNDGTVLAATMNNGVMRSLDGGATWNNVLNDGFKNRASDLEVASNGDVYATTGIFSPGNIWKSTDGGTTWTDILPNGYTVQRIDIGVAPSDPNVLYALMQDREYGVKRSEGGGIIKSVDAGATWKWLPNPVDLDTVVPNEDFTNGQAWYNLIISVDPNNANHVIVGGIDLFQSVDGGDSWTQISKQSNAAAVSDLDLPIVHADQHAIVFRPGSSDEAIFGNDGGVYLGMNLSNQSLPSTGTIPDLPSENQPTISLSGKTIHISGSDKNDNIQVSEVGSNYKIQADFDDGSVNMEEWYAKADVDTIYSELLDGNDQVQYGSVTIATITYGGAGDDQIQGGNGPDTMYGGEGSDQLQGNDGNDFLCGGGGSNDLEGADGNDNVFNLDCDDVNDPAGTEDEDEVDEEENNPDRDGDGLLNNEDLDPENRFICGDSDGDSCDDCSSGVFNPQEDGMDSDGDGLCNDGDPDDDNDGVLDSNDPNPLNKTICGDSDGDTCDDCASGSFDTNNDGTDSDADGLCDAGDLDDDNDGVEDASDLDPLNAFVCGDNDGDGCDDCSSGANDPSNDGPDHDGDGLCDAGDDDDDNDGILDLDDDEPFVAFVASEVDSTELVANDQVPADSTTAEAQEAIVDNTSDSTSVESAMDEIVSNEEEVADSTQVAVNDEIPADSTTSQAEQVIVDNTTDSTSVESAMDEVVSNEEEVADSTQVAVNDEIPADSTTAEAEQVIVDNTSDSTSVESTANEVASTESPSNDSTQVAVNNEIPADSTASSAKVAAEHTSDSTSVASSSRVAADAAHQESTATSEAEQVPGFGIYKSYSHDGQASSYVLSVLADERAMSSYERLDIGFSSLRSKSTFSFFSRLFRKRASRTRVSSKSAISSTARRFGFGLGANGDLVGWSNGATSPYRFTVSAATNSAIPSRIRVKLNFTQTSDENNAIAFTTAPNRPDYEGLEIHDVASAASGKEIKQAEVASRATTNVVIEGRKNNYNVTQFYSVSGKNEENSNYFLAGAQDNGTQRFSTPGKGSTNMVSGGDGTFTHIDQNEPDIQITAHVFNYYFLSTSGGGPFITMMADYSRGRFVNPTDYDDEQNILYAAGNGDELVRISNIRRGATNYVSEIVEVQIDGEQISHIKTSPHTSNRLFVGTGEGGLFVIDNSDEAPQVIKIGGSIDGMGYVSSIEVGADDTQLIVTFSNYGVKSVYETKDMGATWVNKEGDLPDIPVRWSLYNPLDRGQVMLATEVGVWVTNNFDESFPNWVPANEGLANVRCDMLYYRESDGLVSVATFGRGLFTSDIFRSPENVNQPFALTAENTAKSRVDLSWEDNSKIESGYLIQRSLFEDEGYITVGNVGPNIESYNDLTVNNETTYYYRVVATLPIGQSNYSNVASLTTDACPDEIPTGGSWTAALPPSMNLPSYSPVYLNKLAEDVYSITDVSGAYYSLFGFNQDQPAELRVECGEIYIQNSLESGSQFYIIPDAEPGVYDDSTQTITLPWFDSGNGFSLLTNFSRNGDAEPELSAAGITFGEVTDVSMNINVVSGNGAGRLVVMREAEAIDPMYEPGDGVDYLSSSVFGEGDQIGQSYVVGEGDTTTFPVSNLKPGTLYHVAVYEYNQFNGVKDYLTTPYPTNSQFTEVYVVLNEFMAMPPNDVTSGDANGDGQLDASQDEFVEVVNVSGKDLDISNWVLSDGFGQRHTIPDGTVLDSATALVVFGGGVPQGVFGASTVQTASTGSLSLDDTGDQIILKDVAGNLHLSYAYGAEANVGQSLTREPDLTGNFLPHQFAAGPSGNRFSPGTRIDGSWFVPPTCPEIAVNPADLVVSAATGCGSTDGSIEVLSILEGDEPHNPADYTFNWLDVNLEPVTQGTVASGLASGEYYLQVTNVTTYCESDLIAVTVGYKALVDDMQTSISDITENSAVVNWSAIEAEGYSVWYRAGVRLDWMHMDNVSSPFALSDLASGTAYDVRVYPMCEGEVADDASFVEFVTNGATTCDAPTASADLVTENSAEISWVGESGDYNIWYRSGKGSNWTKRDGVQSPYTMTELASGTIYEIRVYSVCEGVASFPTVVDFTTSGSKTCSLPEVEVLQVSDFTSEISWTGSNDGYNVWYRGGTGTLWTKLYDVEAPLTLEGLASGTAYEARVYGVCDDIVGESTEVDFMTTGPVTCETPQVSIHDVTTTTAQVNWSGNSDYYNIWYRTGAGAAWVKLIDELHAPVTLTNLVEGTGYEVRVYGFCGNVGSLAGSTDFATEGEIGCSIPNITISDVTDNGARISWTGNGDAYNFWYRAGRGAKWAKLWNVSGPERLLGSLAPGTDYQLRVYSVCGDLVSDFQERHFQTTGLPYCAAPVVELESLTETTATITWSGDADNAVVYYKQRGRKWTKEKNASKPFEINNLAPGYTYDVQVWNVCDGVTSKVGALSFDTPYTNTVIAYNPDGSMRLPWIQTFAQSTQIPGYVAQAMIEEVEESLEIFPNPAPGVFQLTANNVDLSVLKIRLFSLAGQEIPIVGREKASRRFEVITDAENGIYMLKISNGETEVVRKVVIKY